MKILRTAGSTSNILQIFIADSSSATGAGLTGLVFNTASLTAYFHRDTDTTATAISLVTMTVGTFTSSGFKEIDATNMPGWYQFCPPNTALAAGAKSVSFHLKGATNMAPLPIEVDLDGQVDVNFWNGTAVSSPATAGVPDVNAKNINNVATTSVTTINANQGTTQPINFTGTSTSALVKTDLIDIASAAVSASTAQLGVNLVNINGSAASTSSAQLGVNLVNVAGSAVSTSTAQIGTNVVSVAAAASNIKKNTGLAKFEFLMTDATTHAPKTGVTVTATRSIDGGAFAGCANAVTELANGIYYIDLAAADLNGNVITLRFTGTSSDDRLITLVTQP